jgi:hypothetical protein
VANARRQVLGAELEARGLSSAAAGRLAALLVAQHPLARRTGWNTVRRGLERGGIQPAVAREIALTLLALELLTDGCSFPAVIGKLDTLELAVGEARGAAHEAVRIHRQIQRGAPH